MKVVEKGQNPKGVAMSMKKYETMFVLKPTLTPDEVKEKIEFIKNVIAKEGGVIAGSTDMGTRNLAYKIEKFDRGYYYLVYFEAEGKAIPELERIYKVTEDVIRFIVIKYEKQVELKAWKRMVDKSNGIVAAPAAPVAPAASEPVEA
jgi:small subunit ribosomal protein S6